MIPVPQSPVPTAQRPINGAIAGGGALLFDQLARVTFELLLPVGSEAVTTVASPLVGMAVSAAMATVGDVARSVIVENPPTTFWKKLLLGLASRIG